MVLLDKIIYVVFTLLTKNLNIYETNFPFTFYLIRNTSNFYETGYQCTFYKLDQNKPNVTNISWKNEWRKFISQHMTQKQIKHICFENRNCGISIKINQYISILKSFLEHFCDRCWYRMKWKFSRDFCFCTYYVFVFYKNKKSLTHIPKAQCQLF